MAAHPTPAPAPILHRRPHPAPENLPSAEPRNRPGTSLEHPHPVQSRYSRYSRRSHQRKLPSFVLPGSSLTDRPTARRCCSTAAVAGFPIVPREPSSPTSASTLASAPTRSTDLVHTPCGTPSRPSCCAKAPTRYSSPICSVTRPAHPAYLHPTHRRGPGTRAFSAHQRQLINTVHAPGLPLRVATQALGLQPVRDRVVSVGRLRPYRVSGHRGEPSGGAGPGSAGLLFAVRAGVVRGGAF